LTKTQLSEQHVATYPALGHKSEHKCWHWSLGCVTEVRPNLILQRRPTKTVSTDSSKYSPVTYNRYWLPPT
jgi:hypothetical protein